MFHLAAMNEFAWLRRSTARGYIVYIYMKRVARQNLKLWWLLDDKLHLINLLNHSDMIRLICANDWCSLLVRQPSLFAMVIRRWSDSDVMNAVRANNFHYVVCKLTCSSSQRTESKYRPIWLELETVFVVRVSVSAFFFSPFICLQAITHMHMNSSNGSAGSN